MAKKKQAKKSKGPEVVGKSSGYWGPPEEFTKNVGSVGKRKITFVGASYLFVHKVLRDMLLVGGFQEAHLCLHDIDEVPLKLVGDLLQRIITQTGSTITLSRTLNREEALKGADVVILSITTGGAEADFRSFEVCAKHGIPVGVGDTLGPTALSRNLRVVPVVVGIARDMARLCPKAVMLNFTNPMSVVTGAMARTAGIPAWGLCHSADALFQYFADVFGVKKPDVRMEVGGVNHQAFLTRLWIKGEEKTAGILEAAQKSAAKFKDPLLTMQEEDTSLQQDVFRILKAWPSCGDTHLAEFYRFFFTPRHIGRFGDHVKRLRPGREPFGRREPNPILKEWAYGPEGVGDLHLLTSEHSHELMWAYLTGQPYTRVLNVLNTDELIRGLPKTACVEALVTVAGPKVTGEPIALPPAVHALVTNWTTIHELSFQAAMNRDRDAARQALFLDPHVGDLYDIEPLLEDMLGATRQWLPKGWFKE